MDSVKPCYLDMIDKVTEKLKKYKDCFLFAVAADSHLDNSLSNSLANIRAVDKGVGFRCLVHLGDFLNGNLSREYTKTILAEQMAMYENSIAAKRFYPVQGNHDGFADRCDHMRNDMALDEDWYEATAFVSAYDNVTRDHGKPYYFVDYPEERIRMIVLCTMHYTGYDDGSRFEKVYGTDASQIEWLENTALTVGEGWTVMIFSHDAPFERFDKNACIDNPRINGNLLMETVKRAEREKGFTLAAWFVGHFHGDYIGRVNGIRFILVACQTAYMPQLWDMPEGGYYPNRELGTCTEDLWDAVALDKENKKIRLIRFGAGEDREMRWGD